MVDQTSIRDLITRYRHLQDQKQTLQNNIEEIRYSPEHHFQAVILHKHLRTIMKSISDLTLNILLRLQQDLAGNQKSEPVVKYLRVETIRIGQPSAPAPIRAAHSELPVFVRELFGKFPHA